MLTPPRRAIPVAVRLQGNRGGLVDVTEIESQYRSNQIDLGVLIIPSSDSLLRRDSLSPASVVFMGTPAEVKLRLSVVPLAVFNVDA